MRRFAPLCDGPDDERLASGHVPRGEDARHAVQACIQEVRMIERFSNLAHSGKLEEEWPNDATATMQVCDALLESAHCNQIIQLDSTP